MKTDISIPIPVFEAAENLAKEMGVSLSEFYTVAIHAYITEHQKENITEALNQVYANEESALEPQFIKMQVISLESKEW
jgi:metal-responsive CopG/Arc/MetJ family transcriptional regulator